MAGISQSIPNYAQGISQQPDELKLPGQLRDIVNGDPDVTDGLQKRLGTKHIRNLINPRFGTNGKGSPDGTWFDMYYGPNPEEQYIGCIYDQKVHVWNMEGIQCLTYYAETPYNIDINDSQDVRALDPEEPIQYLKVENNDALVTSKIEELTYITNPQVKVGQVTLDQDTSKNFQSQFNIRQVAYGREYFIAFNSPTTDSSVVSSFTRVKEVRGEFRGGFDISKSKDESCKYRGKQTFVQDDFSNIKLVQPPEGRETPEGLVIDVEILGTQGTTPNTDYDPEDGEPAYWPNCSYSLKIDIRNAGFNWLPGDSFIVKLDDYTNNNADNRDDFVKIRVFIEEINSESFNAGAAYIYATTTSSGDESISARDILGALVKGLEEIGITQFENEDGSQYDLNEGNNSSILQYKGTLTGKTADWFRNGGFKYQLIGNGIYITSKGEPQYQFSLNTTEDQLFNILNTVDYGKWWTSASTIARLPTQSKHNLVVEITSDSNADDSYFLKFVGDSKSDGEGTWQETVQPGQQVAPDGGSMPHELRRLSPLEFRYGPIKWEAREAGNKETNPKPSFIGSYILNVNSYRNRLLLLSNSHVILSRAGKEYFYDFWKPTVLISRDDDPVDLIATSDTNVFFRQSITVASGMLLFSHNAQFLLTTDADVFKATTAKLNHVASYSNNTTVEPLTMGSNVGFIDDHGGADKFYEMTGVSRESEPTVVELSKVISSRMPDNMSLFTSSKENQIVAMAPRFRQSRLNEDLTRYGYEYSREVWVYKYFNSGDKRIQSAWTRYVFDLPITYMTIIDDVWYGVFFNNHQIALRSMGLRYETGNRQIFLDGHLDVCNRREDGVCDFNENILIKLEEGLWNDGDCVTASLYPDIPIYPDPCVDYSQPIVEKSVTVNFSEDGCSHYIVLPSEYKAECNKQRLVIGKPYQYRLEFPTIYVTKSSGETARSTVHPNCTIHRLKFDVGTPADYELKIERASRDDVYKYFEVTDPWPKNTEHLFTMPIYMRNRDINITMWSESNRPASLYSMTWEGDYNPTWYKRV